MLEASGMTVTIRSVKQGKVGQSIEAIRRTFLPKEHTRNLATNNHFERIASNDIFHMLVFSCAAEVILWIVSASSRDLRKKSLALAKLDSGPQPES